MRVRECLIGCTIATIVASCGGVTHTGVSDGGAAACTVSSLSVQTLQRPPSALPALRVANGIATGRTVKNVGEGETYSFQTESLSRADWDNVRTASCKEVAEYGLGAVTVADGGPPSSGGSIYILINNTSQGALSLQLGATKAPFDNLLPELRTIATRYFGMATF